MAEIELAVGEVERVGRAAVGRFGLSAIEEATVWEQLWDAELRGKTTHGLVRVPWLLGKLRQCHKEVPQPAEETGWISRYDAKGAVGYFLAEVAADRARDRALAEGLHLAVCRDAFPTGVLGYYLERLTGRGLCGLAFCTTPALVKAAPEGERLFGTDPVAFAVPGGPEGPVIADLTGAPTSFGQVLAACYDAPLPAEGLLTAEGKVPTGPEEMFARDPGGPRFTGTILQDMGSPAGRRGFALLTALELAMSLLAGPPGGAGHFAILALAPERLGLDAAAVQARADELTARLAPGRLPGRHGAERRRRVLESGRMRLPGKLWRELSEMAG
ncbi:Malate/lactate/ureidoglycolate dehydrogenase, LDH2 family [Tistlia consotensis]|uniref:Malate/lactate/ureidoglycolate dehydrogenase, LDH2 family n=1 Tax=Tistlia consotensis USBA 355 TaxID=560819 RepID=A0A1Y6CKY2_9PROT|nr:Ldh family oxidoreductase [Tistlia consotensis]SMF72522.1 Malate/lactate/ureidoglycolate dehydrogenase, LDH2 family [Tistlia consotensis USBA 355]SNS09282.1 Malate/lactate/ureidoglycolate dehydrogenase, LDH2 family [Tistlia consotensis]